MLFINVLFEIMLLVLLIINRILFLCDFGLIEIFLINFIYV